YGGFAELAVINIITRGATELHGISASASYGQMEHGLGQRNVSLSYGEKYRSGLSLAISGFVGQGNRSDATYTAFSCPAFASADASADGAPFVNPALG